MQLLKNASDTNSTTAFPYEFEPTYCFLASEMKIDTVLMNELA
jgi:hypothetical protein